MAVSVTSQLRRYAGRRLQGFSTVTTHELAWRKPHRYAVDDDRQARAKVSATEVRGTAVRSINRNMKSFHLLSLDRLRRSGWSLAPSFLLNNLQTLADVDVKLGIPSHASIERLLCNSNIMCPFLHTLFDVTST